MASLCHRGGASVNWLPLKGPTSSCQYSKFPAHTLWGAHSTLWGGGTHSNHDLGLLFQEQITSFIGRRLEGPEWFQNGRGQSSEGGWPGMQICLAPQEPYREHGAHYSNVTMLTERCPLSPVTCVDSWEWLHCSIRFLQPPPSLCSHVNSDHTLPVPVRSIFLMLIMTS